MIDIIGVCWSLEVRGESSSISVIQCLVLGRPSHMIDELRLIQRNLRSTAFPSSRQIFTFYKPASLRAQSRYLCWLFGSNSAPRNLAERLPSSVLFPTMSSNYDSIYNIDNASPAISTPDDEIDSLPDSAPSDDIDDDEEQESDAEKEWKESLQQLELILTMVLVPYAGKYFGRKCAYWGEC